MTFLRFFWDDWWHDVVILLHCFVIWNPRTGCENLPETPGIFRVQDDLTKWGFQLLCGVVITTPVGWWLQGITLNTNQHLGKITIHSGNPCQPTKLMNSSFRILLIGLTCLTIPSTNSWTLRLLTESCFAIPNSWQGRAVNWRDWTSFFFRWVTLRSNMAWICH